MWRYSRPKVSSVAKNASLLGNNRRFCAISDLPNQDPCRWRNGFRIWCYYYPATYRWQVINNLTVTFSWARLHYHMLPTPSRHKLLSLLKFLQPQSRSSQVFSPNKLLISRLARRTMATAMAKRLEGKTILVTGASSGIGKSTGLSATSKFDKHHADEIQQWNSPEPHLRTLSWFWRPEGLIPWRKLRKRLRRQSVQGFGYYQWNWTSATLVRWRALSIHYRHNSERLMSWWTMRTSQQLLYPQHGDAC